MKLIKPSEVSSKIMTLIEESEEKIILVSPYVKINKWYKLLRKIDEAKERKLKIEFYIRAEENSSQNRDEVLRLDIEPIEIPNLHCKLYFNEKKAIITSMNLLLSSEINSLEIGYETDTKEEYNEVIEFYTRYIAQHKKNDDDKNKESSHWLDLIYDDLSVKNRRLKITGDDYNIEIKTALNTYQVFLWNDRNENKLRIGGILSGKQFEAFSNRIESFQRDIGLEIDLVEGKQGHYDMIWGTSKKSFNSKIIHNIPKSEYDLISKYVYRFIDIVDEGKRSIY